MLLALAALAVGCGGPKRPPLAKVSGVVTLDESPVAGASVMFTPVAGGRPARGVTDESGRFHLTTIDDGDGALLGEHRVTVTLKKLSGIVATSDGLSGVAPPGGIQEEWLVPERYSHPDTSQLSVTVERGMKEVPLALQTQP